MRTLLLFILSGVLFMSVQAQEESRRTISYALGFDMGKHLHEHGLEILPETFIKGLKAGMNQGKPALSEEVMQMALLQVQAKMREHQQLQAHASGEKNQQEGEAFLASYRKKEGVQSLEGGVLYRVLKPSDEKATPSAQDRVKVHYEGKLVDGQIFDSSYSRGEPTVFGVNQVIRGWQQMLMHMHPGEAVEAVIPAALAYGDHGAGGMIGPNAVLIFKIELIAIEPTHQ